ncbi:MBL fold metallo-hydrolase [Halieaceae bacterium IMCC14734]|uniref:MBL fold metallo-hydrolase n=1 Tax=Candidatus Litorirhabdus singularis TaxID=2518993 RepID=A0ABT3TF10_9GAMM|nr:MBL fold metallo-hydrolase [Candidatus Litorirhabdus singularis]MCX2980903.1 MBL fold metallo-hydrolase [Candidatus Litorirhabdus singularis]
MKRSILLSMTLLAVIMLAYSQRATIATQLLEKGLESRLGADRVTELEDGLHLALCGAGGPLPSPNASGPCVAVIAGKQLFVVDVGTDSPRNLGRMGYQTGNVQGVFLTHFHSDHIDGLGELATLRWAGGDNKQPLPVHGPVGVERVVDGFNMAYAQDFVYRNEHHGDSVAPLSGAGLVAKPFTKPALGELATLIDDGELKVEALAVEHAPVEPAVGYRFSYKGRTILITGDTVKYANIEQFAQGVDLLVHEALAPNLVNMMHEAANKNGNEILAKITHDILDYHASPVEAAETARDADVGHLLYYHIVPPLIIPGQKTLYLNGAEDIFPNYTIGADGVAFSLPANSKEIIQTSNGL